MADTADGPRRCRRAAASLIKFWVGCSDNILKDKSQFCLCKVTGVWKCIPHLIFETEFLVRGRESIGEQGHFAKFYAPSKGPFKMQWVAVVKFIPKGLSSAYLLSRNSQTSFNKGGLPEPGPHLIFAVPITLPESCLFVRLVRRAPLSHSTYCSCQASHYST